MNTVVQILLIEDDQMDYLTFNRTVSKLERVIDFELDWVNNSADALETLKDKTYDIVFVDYFLNDDDALSLLKQLDEAGCNGPYIMLTGNDDPDLYAIGEMYPVYDYILKDEMSPSVLERTILFSLKRQQIENDARRTDMSLEFLRDQINKPLFELAAGRTITCVNDLCASVFGEDSGALIGQDISPYVEGDVPALEGDVGILTLKSTGARVTIKCINRHGGCIATIDAAGQA